MYRKWDVVKIDGEWFVITDIKKEPVYHVISEENVFAGEPKTRRVLEEDIRWKIGDLEEDTVGLGRERWEREVLPLIEKS